MKQKFSLFLLLLPAAVGAQTITTFTNRAAFEAAMENFKVVDDFSLGATFLNGTTTNGTINAAGKWADIAQNPPPSTTWATPFGSTAFGGTWDNTVAGVGGGLEFELDFGGGTIVTVPGGVAGNAPANTFFGFTADEPFLNVRMRLPAAAVLGETHTLDDLTVQVPSDWQDVRFVQAGAGAWDTAGHWDLAAVPGANQRVFITPAGGAVVSGPAVAANVRQLAIGNGTAASRLNLDAAGTLTVTRSAVVKANSTLGGAGRLDGALTMAAGSTLTVGDGQTLQAGTAAANGFSTAGTITIGTGTLILEDTGATPLGTLTTLAGGTLTALGGTAQIGSGDTLRGNGSLTGAFELQTGGTLRAQNGTLQVAQLTAADGTATVDLAHTLSVGGTNTLGFATTTVGAGSTLAAGGTLQLIVASTLSAGATVRGGLGLQLSGTVSHAGAQVFDAGAGDLLINQISFTPDAADSLLGARLVMTGPSATLNFSSDAMLGPAGNQLVLNGGRLFPQSSVTLPPARSVEVTTLNGSVIALAGRTFAVEGNISGAGRLALTGSSGGIIGGTVRLAGNNSHGGGTDIAGVTLEIASDASLGGPNGVLLIGRENGLNDIPGRLRALGNLDIAATRSTTFRLATVDTNGFNAAFNQPISGDGLTKEGAGVLRLNTKNANDNLHSVVIIEGALRMGTNDSLGLGAQVFSLAGAVLDLNGLHHELVNVNGDGDIALGAGTLTTRGTSSIGGVISGTGGVVMKFDGGRLLGENTFTGGLTLQDGAIVAVKTTAGFGGAGNAVLLDNGGIFADFEAPAPVVIGAAFPMTIAAGGARFGANGQPLIIEALLTGANPLSVQGGGTGYEVRFAHAANTFTGNLAIGSSDFGSAVLGIVADGSLGNAANVITLGYRFFDGESTRTGTGTLRAFADIVFPAARTLRLNGQSNDGGGVFDANGFNMTVTTPLTELHAGTPLRKTGAGTLTLNGVSTYTGRTDVDDGILVVSGSLSGEVAAFSAGTLSGTGTVGSVGVFSGGTLAPGNSPGTLHTGNVTFSGGTFALDFASPTLGDQLAVTGSVTLTGDVELTLLPGYTPAAGNSFVIIANDGADPIETFGGTTFFSIAGNQLTEGETFSAAGASWKISYTGGDGNDVTLTAQAAAPAGPDFTAFTFGPPTGGGPGGQITAAITGPADTLLNLEASSDLVVWSIIGSATTSSGGTANFDITDTAATGSRRYYRAVIP